MEYIEKAEKDPLWDKGVWYENKYAGKWKREESPYVLMIDFSKAKKTTQKFPKPTPGSLREVEPQIKMEYV